MDVPINFTTEQSPPIKECVLVKKSDHSIEWVREKLAYGCTCDNISLWNQGRLQLYCDSFPFIHEASVQIFYNTIFMLLIIFAVTGNLTVVWIVLRHERMRTVTNYYLLNLAISDLLITILNTGFNATYNLYYNWIFTEAHCAFNNLMGITPICASVFTMIVMSIDRYIAIVYPLRRRPGRRKTITIIVGIWILAILCGIPALAATKIETHFFVDPQDLSIFEDRLCLADRFPDGNSQTSILFSIYNNSLVIMQYLIPLLILSFTYGRVATVLRKNETIGDTRHAESVKAKKKAANMLALVVFSFIFMWLPYNLYFLFLSNYLMSHEIISPKNLLYLYVNIYCLGMSSCLLNPVIYYFMNERFRIGFRYAFRWVPCVKIKRDEYLTVFSMTGSRASNLGSRNHANTIYSAHNGSNRSGRQTPIPL